MRFILNEEIVKEDFEEIVKEDFEEIVKEDFKEELTTTGEDILPL